MSRGSTLLVCLCLLTPVVARATTPPPEAPDLELLEFLGEWGDEGDAWLQQQQNEQQKSVAAPRTEVKQNDE